jgi:hypothetical protein
MLMLIIIFIFLNFDNVLLHEEIIKMLKLLLKFLKKIQTNYDNQDILFSNMDFDKL